MPKFVRKQPLIERIKSFLNPYDFLLWLSEEIESNGWDQLEKEWAIPIALIFNLVFLIARANVNNIPAGYDDVFGDSSGPGWIAWLSTFLVHFLTLFAFVNAAYTFWRKKHYRLFENNVEVAPSTPSAYKVKVDSSPVASSPLRLLSRLIGSESAQSRAHPDPQNDVWEIAVWDPLPVSLRLFCYFSPGHVIIYLIFLPTVSTDPRPSITVLSALLVAALLSFQLAFLNFSFSRQIKDTSFISKEVLHEYDVKYVRPRTQPLYRDVGIQNNTQESHEQDQVLVDVPRVVINRGFKPNPNPNYAQHVDPEGLSTSTSYRQQVTASSIKSPLPNRDPTSVIRPVAGIRQPVFRPTGDGGSLGVYSHAASPLRKSASTHFSPTKALGSNPMSREAFNLSPERRAESPSKRMSVPSQSTSTALAGDRWAYMKADRNRRESGRV